MDKKDKGAVRELNPRPLAPEARIIPLDQRPAIIYAFTFVFGDSNAYVLRRQYRAPFAKA